MADVHGNGEAPRAWVVGLYAGALKCRSFGGHQGCAWLGISWIGSPESSATNSGEMRGAGAEQKLIKRV